MIQRRKGTTVCGFEDYKCFNLLNEALDGKLSSYYWAYNLSSSIVFDKNTVGYTGNSSERDLYSELYKDNKGLLNTAERVFVHPSCKLSRSLLAEKYKRCTSPYVADAVIIPDFERSNAEFQSVALFVNEECNTLVCSILYDPSIKEKLINSIGRPLKEFTGRAEEGILIRAFGRNYSDALDAVLEGVEDAWIIPNHEQVIFDLCTGVIPTNKTVYESTIMQSLGTEDNKITLESITSIKEMLDSRDDNTQAAALKALSMMDYVHYPNSIVYMLRQVSYIWKYNDATGSTSVKYMLKALLGQRWRGSYGCYTDVIFPQDLELLKQLIMYYKGKGNDNIMSLLSLFPFTTVNVEGRLVIKYQQ